MTIPHADVCLDASGLWCPQPLLQAKQQLKQLSAGEILKVIATDPSSVVDFKVFAVTTGNELIYFVQQASRYEFWLRKKRD